MQIIKVNTKDMNPEKAINYLITHHAALKVEGYAETAEAVHMGLGSLQAWKKVKEEIEDERQKYIENYNDEAVEIIDAICEIIDSRFKRMVWERRKE